MRPPDAPEAAEAATDQALRDENRSQNGTVHDPAGCATCRGGVQAWTPERRARALIYAATSRRRIIDLAAS